MMAVHLHNHGLDVNTCFNNGNNSGYIVTDPSIPCAMMQILSVCLVQLSHDASAWPGPRQVAVLTIYDHA